jgi:hypothetical protein
VDAWQAAGEGLNPQIARLAFDIGKLTFANAWVALGSLSIASGWAVLATRAEPGWLGWWAVAAGAGLVVACTAWTMPGWMIPYAMFWLWVLILATRILISHNKQYPSAAADTDRIR